MHFNTINLKGKVFGRLTVLSLHPERGRRGQLKWNCQCSCGNKHIVTGESLRSGKSKSCGCLLRECRFAKNDNTDRTVALLKIQYSPINKRHRKINDSNPIIPFHIFRTLSFSNCFYCGARPNSRQEDVRYENRRGERKKLNITDTVIFINGIDRIDSRKGYSVGNVVSCCRLCNTAKNSLSQSEFKKMITKIYKYWAKR